MPITEAQRFEMHLGLRNNLGDDVANSLMEHLPPSGWSDVARTHDIERLDNRITALESRLSRDIHGLRNTSRVIIGTMITISLGLFGLLLQISQAVSSL
jgi:hypothetical protein